MATAAYLLSQHSSNPLEVHSSDARNSLYVRNYRRALVARSQLSSDDTIGGAAAPELQEYHEHLKAVCNVPISASTSTMARVPPGFVDLDEGMDSEEAEAEADLQVKQEEKDGEGFEHDEDEDLDVEIQDAEDATEQNVDTDHEEENSILLKPQDEQADIQTEIEDLERAVPRLSSDYRLVDRLGTGTFSSVYKAIDLGFHDKWHNGGWTGPFSKSSISAKKDQGKKVFVAIKRIYVTSGPERIRNEISIMEDCRSCRHVSQLITAFRHKDQVVAIMPYHRNEDFRNFYRILPLEGIKSYFRCMFRALRDIHSRGIIHRDVKPANFLFDPRTGLGTLCDFGLACRMERSQTLGMCLHTPPNRTYPHGRVKHIDDCNITAEEVKKAQREARQRSNGPSEKVGYLAQDRRPPSKANRAGTRGFRAPEVLLKCSIQSGAVDMWSAGVIMLFFLTKKFPIFQSSDDTEALMEVAAIIGKKRMEKTATLHSRTFATNVPAVSFDGIPWSQFVERLSPDLYIPTEPDRRFYPYTSQAWARQHQTRPPPSSSSPPTSRYSSSRSPSPHPSALPEELYREEMKKALDLLERLMSPESVRRITPKEALSHPFLKEPDDLDDDEFVPHRFGEGVCGGLHFLDEVTDEPCVKVRKARKRTDAEGEGDEDEMVVRRLVAGEGIAIGNMPCEFHTKELGYEF